MRVLLWLIVVALLAWAGLQFWRAWRLGAFGGMGRAPRTRRAPAPDASVFDLPAGPDVTSVRSEPVFAQPAWAADPAEPAFAPPPAPAASPFPPQAPAMSAQTPPSFAASPAPPPFPPPVPDFAPRPVSGAAVSPAFVSEPVMDKAGATDMDGGEATADDTTTRDEVLQMFGRDLRALRHAIEVQRNTLSRLEEDLHMLENHLNGRQPPARRS